MAKVIYLKKGEVYFHAAYSAEKPYYPLIDTYIYDGKVEGAGYTFINANTGDLICFDNNKITCLYDRKNLAEWVLKPTKFSKPLEEFEYVAL